MFSDALGAAVLPVDEGGGALAVGPSPSLSGVCWRAGAGLANAGLANAGLAGAGLAGACVPWIRLDANAAMLMASIPLCCRDRFYAGMMTKRLMGGHWLRLSHRLAAAPEWL